MMSDELTYNPDDKLEEMLARLAAGIPLQEALADAGADAEWLRPLLEIATEVGELRQVIPIPPPQASLERLLAYGKKLAATSQPITPAQPGWQTVLSNLFSNSWGFRLATGLVTALLVVILLGGGLTAAAQNSLPGETIYGVKRAGEALQLSLTWDPVQYAQLLETFNQRRRMETQLLLEQGKQATVSFEGYIETLTTSAFTIDDLSAKITPETEITGELTPQARIYIEAVTQPPDGLIILSITVLESASSTDGPLPIIPDTRTSVPALTDTPTATATPPPTHTSTPIVTVPPTEPPATNTPMVSPSAPVIPFNDEIDDAGSEADDSSDNSDYDDLDDREDFAEDDYADDDSDDQDIDSSNDEDEDTDNEDGDSNKDHGNDEDGCDDDKDCNSDDETGDDDSSDDD